MKACSKCNITKPLAGFYCRANGKYYAECKTCNNSRNKGWKGGNKAKRSEHGRRNWLKSKYGITPEQWEAMLASQGGKCATCKSLTPKRAKNWMVDHCHRTGRVRGLLCHSCNVALGHIKDSVAVLRAMQDYLEQS